jgi:hypothetical protein
MNELVELGHGGGWLEGWKNKLEEKEQGHDANERNDDWAVRRSWAGLQAKGAEEDAGKPQVGPPNHGGFGKAIEQDPIDKNGHRDARDEDELVEGFHLIVFDDRD